MQQTLLIFLLLISIEYIAGLCDQRPYGGELKCCRNKDSKCFVKSKETNKLCYCDSYCRYTNDCCQDYELVEKLCRATDCKVSKWTEWEPCLGKCGYGISKRTRNIVQSPKNGGKRCPTLLEKRRCNTNKICVQETVVHDRAFILPNSYRRPKFGNWMYEEILPAKKGKSDLETNESSIVKNSYCIYYDVKFRKRKCKKSWASEIKANKIVCVECQSRAMKDGGCRGEGAIGRKSRWEALGVKGCQGNWIKRGPLVPNCSCPKGGYVFV